MVLVQILINASNNNTYFTVPVTGKSSIRVLGLQYCDNGGQTNRVLQLQSDNLYFPYSPQRFLTWMAATSSSACSSIISFDNSRDAYHIKNQLWNGQLLLNVVSLYSSGGSPLPASFQCIVTIEFEEIDMEFK